MAKVRVYELAKEFGVESKTVMVKLQEMGEFVRSASSTIEAPVVRRLKEAFGPEGGKQGQGAGRAAGGSAAPRAGRPGTPSSGNGQGNRGAGRPGAPQPTAAGSAEPVAASGPAAPAATGPASPATPAATRRPGWPGDACGRHAVGRRCRARRPYRISACRGGPGPGARTPGGAAAGSAGARYVPPQPGQGRDHGTPGRYRCRPVRRAPAPRPVPQVPHEPAGRPR